MTESHESPASVPAEAAPDLEALQAREGRQAVTEPAFRDLLRLVDPQPHDDALAYRDVLGRLANVIARNDPHG